MFSRNCSWLIICLFLPLAGCSDPPEARQPNILLFLVDDMGWQDTSVSFHSEPTAFNHHFRTPNMERLASSGVVFTQAYAAPVCSPTRTSIMTGQSPARHRVTNWTLFADRDQSGETDRLAAPHSWRKEGLQPDALTLPKLLHEEGYLTIHCGKAHWGTYGTAGADPLALGFDVNIAGHPAGAPGDYHGTENFGNEEPGVRTPPWGVPGLEKYHGKNVHLTDVLTTEAIAAVGKAVAAGKPFYLYMAHYAVHTPIQEHQPYYEQYLDRDYPGTDVGIPEVEARYASMVEGMDASLGALLAEFESLGIAENTLVVFTSDNGGLSAHTRGTTPYDTAENTHNRPLKAGKGSAYEGGTRVPMIVSWAKANSDNTLQQQLSIRSGDRLAEPVISEDLFPTIVHWAGGSIPESYREMVDGLDITGSITQSDPVPSDRILVFHYPHVWGPQGPGYEPHSSIRQGDWKAIYFYDNRDWELYNLAEDLAETEDLAGSHREKLKDLAGLMKARFDEMGAQYPVRKETGEEEIPLWPYLPGRTRTE